MTLNAAGNAALQAAMLAALTAPGVDQIWPPPESEDAARRRKFLHHFGYLDSNTRHPSPYIQFAGKPGASHYGVPFDAQGFLNATAITAHKPPGETRIFVVGDSTTIDGGTLANTLPGRLERILRAQGRTRAKVYNFGVMSSCLTQMTHLIWSKLVGYQPDAIVVVNGSTDLFQPWTYDPRPGYPYNAFITERLYDHFFDTHDPRAREDGLSYDALVTLIYEELKRLRAEVGWQTPGWEDAIVHHYRLAAHRLTKLSHDHAVPIVSVLQPTVLRKRHLTEVERNVASGHSWPISTANTPSWRRSPPSSRRGGPTAAPSRPSTSAASSATGRRGPSTTSSITTTRPGDRSGAVGGEVAKVLDRPRTPFARVRRWLGGGR